MANILEQLGINVKVGNYRGKPVEIKLGGDHVLDIIRTGSPGVRRTLIESAYKVPVYTVLKSRGIKDPLARELSQAIKDEIRAAMEKVVGKT